MTSPSRVAIVGAACRLPGGIDGLSELWSALADEADLVSEPPPGRYDAAQLADPTPGRRGRLSSSAGGYLDDVAGFDADYFGMSGAEASRVDPQQRLALELAVEALDDAGIDAETLAGSDTAVVVGAGNVDYLELQHLDLRSINAYTNIGGLLCNISARVSHALDLHGQSMTVDTACSASLTAIHEVCAMLASGRTRLGLAGGVNILLSPGFSIGAAQASITSPTGRCHTFSARADGYVRAEGGGMLVLKRLEDALEDGDRVHAVIAGTAANFDGRTPGLSQPSARAQELLLRQVYPGCGVAPRDVVYVEAHGTGTPVGDATECAALGAVLGRPGTGAAPLPIGSMKTNVGHLESAAGVVGLLKAMLVLHHGYLPASLRAEPLSPNIDFGGLGLAPVVAGRPLHAGERDAVGVSAFGFGGANAHVALVRAPVVSRRMPGPERDGALPMLVSARTPEAAVQAAEAMAARLDGAAPADVYDACWVACRRRTRHAYRIAAIGRGGAELSERLLAAAAEPPVAATSPGGVAFAFCGNGSQWAGMGAGLLAEDAAFAAAVRDVDAALAPHLGWSVTTALTDATADDMRRSTVAVPALFAVQMGIVAALEERGVTPDVVLGHSVGELAAAHACGALDLDTACRLVATRARCVEPAAGTGGMAAVGVDGARALALVADFGGAIELAAVNGPSDVTLCGDIEALRRLGERVGAQGTFFRLLDIDYPYHSRAMVAPAAQLRAALDGMTVHEAARPMISTVTGEPVTELDAEYWAANLTRPVRFDVAVTRATERCGVFVDVGPHPVLSAYLRRRPTPPATFATLRRDAAGAAALDGAVAGVVAAGGRVRWERWFAQRGSVVDLPRYPWQRERHWNGEVSRWTPPVVHPLLGVAQPTPDPSWLCEVDRARTPWFGEHVIGGADILPAGASVEIALAVGGAARGDTVQVDRLELLEPVAVAPAGADAGQLRVSLSDDGRVHVAGRGDGGWRTHARGRVSELRAQAPPDVDLSQWRRGPVYDGEAFYADSEAVGYGWRGTFQVLREIQGSGEHLCARYELRDAQDGYHVHPALLDGTMQAALLMLREASDRMALPVFVGRTRWWEQPAATGYALVARRVANEDQLVVDVTVVNDDGRVAMDVREMRLRCVGDGPRGAPDVIVTELRATADQPRRRLPRPARGATVSLATERGFHAAAAAVSAHFIAAALRELLGGDVRWTLDGLRDAGMRARHAELVRGLCVDAESAGVLVADGDGWRPAVEPATARHVARALEDLPQLSEYWLVAVHCGTRLADVLRGRIDPLELHAPQSGGDAEALIESDALFGAHHAAVAEAVAAATPRGAPVRILELGAGGGGLTARLLDRLDPQRARYTATDPSAANVQRCERRFAGRDHVACRVLDAELHPGEQDIEEASFDVVVAGMGVLPPAELAWLLADGGHVVALAPRNEAPWRLVFGFAEGRWAGDGALLDRWLGALRSSDFSAPQEAAACGDRSLITTRRASRAPAGAPTPRRRDWLLVADRSTTPASELVAALGAGGAVRTMTPEELTTVAAETDVVVMPATITDPTEQVVADLAALRSVSAATEQAGSASVTVVCPAAGLFDVGAARDDTVGAGLWGAARCLANERPALPIRRLAVTAGTPPEEVVEALVRGGADDELVLTAGGRYATRVVARNDAPTHLESLRGRVVELHATPASGAPRLRWTAADMPVPGLGEVVIRVHAASLNYRDAMLLEGRLRTDLVMSDAIGGDCAGMVTAVGEGVAGWRPGDRVFARARGAFATHAIADAGLVARMPPDLGFTAAATLPTIWHTIHHALVRRVRLGPGQTILVHAAAGGIGLAAIRHAQSVGATVIATAGSEAKRALVRLLGVEHVLDSRDLSFADEIAARTGGVDVVLNSLAGEAVERGLRLVRDGGHFVELGKWDRQADRPLAMGALGRGVTLHVVDLDLASPSGPERAAFAEEFAEVGAAVAAGRYGPLPHRVYPAARIADAFEAMMHARHVGKVVIALDDDVRVPLAHRAQPLRLDPDATYLVIGGTGGFGAASARWLAARGAGHIVAASRRGARAPEAAATAAALRAAGAEPTLVAADVTDREQLVALLATIDASGHPLRGVVHAAMVWHNAPLSELDDGALRAVVGPKVTGGALLDELTRDRDLDLFWLYSSLSTTLGIINQASYAAANLHLDAIARMRCGEGGAALSIGWGLIGDAGMALRASAEYAGMVFEPADADVALRGLETALCGDRAVIALGRPRWSQVAELLPGTRTPRFELVAPVAAESSGERAALQAIRGADPERAQAAAVEAVGRILADVLQVAHIAPRRSISQLGLDSLMAVQVQAELWHRLQCELATVRILTSGGIGELAAAVCAKLNAGGDGRDW